MGIEIALPSLTPLMPSQCPRLYRHFLGRGEGIVRERKGEGRRQYWHAPAKGFCYRNIIVPFQCILKFVYGSDCHDEIFAQCRNEYNNKKCLHLKCRGSRHWTRWNSYATTDHYATQKINTKCWKYRKCYTMHTERNPVRGAILDSIRGTAHIM